mmetsp:Transcript_28671/g.80393  ORF Transcript_28671/g.80393 Transcript_28671/m.80393 type:complete len:117 (+) Transcript_28671:446-796(+)
MPASDEFPRPPSTTRTSKSGAEPSSAPLHTCTTKSCLAQDTVLRIAQCSCDPLGTISCGQSHAAGVGLLGPTGTVPYILLRVPDETRLVVLLMTSELGTPETYRLCLAFFASPFLS